MGNLPKTGNKLLIKLYYLFVHNATKYEYIQLEIILKILYRFMCKLQNAIVENNCQIK